MICRKDGDNVAPYSSHSCVHFGALRRPVHVGPTRNGKQGSKLQYHVYCCLVVKEGDCQELEHTCVKEFQFCVSICLDMGID